MRALHLEVLLLVGVVTGMVSTGCGRIKAQAPANQGAEAYTVALTVATPANLPTCTAQISGTVAFVDSPASLWKCQAGQWIQIPCSTLNAGSVAYANLTGNLWACIHSQWTAIALPPSNAWT